MLNLISKLKQLPDHWLLCLTVLLFPIFLGSGFKIAVTDTLSYSNGSTQIALGETVQESDRLIAQQQEQITRLTESIQLAQQAARDKKIKLPELKQVQQIAKETEKLSNDLVTNSETLQELVETNVD